MRVAARTGHVRTEPGVWLGAPDRGAQAFALVVTAGAVSRHVIPRQFEFFQAASSFKKACSFAGTNLRLT